MERKNCERNELLPGEVDDEQIEQQDDINRPEGDSGYAAIHWSCHYGQLNTTEKLLEYGSNPNLLARNYISPLHLAAASGHHEIVRLLISRGAKVDQMDILGNTPLHYAAGGNFPHSTNEILSQTQVEDVMLENEDGKTAYHLAIENKAHLAQAVIENFIMNVLS